MALPSNVTTRTVTGRYLDATGAPVRGSVTFELDLVVLDSDANVVIVPTQATAPLDSTGSFAITLPVSDDVDLDPTGWVYTIRENFDNGRTFAILLTSNLSDPVDLSTLAPVAPTPDPVYSFVLTTAINAPSGVAGLDSSGLLDPTQFPGITASMIDSEASVAGLVLTSDGAGGATFAPGGGGGGDSFNPFLLMGA